MTFGLCLSFATHCKASQSDDSVPSELDSYIVRSLREAEVPGAAIAIVKDGRVLAKGYGVRRVGNPVAVDGNTLFDSASLMKSFTAAAIGVLIDEGKLKLDDPVRKHLPWLEFFDPYLTAHVTIRDLLTHRVGLKSAHALFRFTGFTTREVLERIVTLEPQTPFRTGVTYSNILYTAAGEAAAAACGCTFGELVTTRIIKPLKLERTRVGGNPLEDANASYPHDLIDGRQQELRWRWMDYNTDPAGGLLSTAYDLGKWLLFHAGDGTWEGKRVLSKEMLLEMHSPQVLIASSQEWRDSRKVEFFGGYGLGWNVMDYRGHPMIWHSGGGDGMPVYMTLLPKEKLGVVVLLNTWSAPYHHGAIASRIFDHYLGVEPYDWAGELLPVYANTHKKHAEEERRREASRKAGANPSLPLSSYAGRYEHPTYGPIEISLSDKNLAWKIAKGAEAELIPWQFDTFFVRWRDPVFREAYPAYVTFILNEDGEAVRFRITLLRDEIEAVRAGTP
ncbi:serine hydrolase [bacterium]|nr:serine hydrolase [bacterium]